VSIVPHEAKALPLAKYDWLKAK